MAKQLKVTHAEGFDLLGDAAFVVEEGVLLVFTDHRKTALIKAYNREVWAFAEFVEVDA